MIPIEDQVIKKGSIVLIKHRMLDGTLSYLKARVESIDGNFLWIDKSYNSDKLSHHFLVSSDSVVGIEFGDVLAVQPEFITRALDKLRRWSN